MTSPVRVPRPTPRGVHAAPALPAPRVRPDLRVVRDPARRSRTGLFVGLSVVLVFGALLAAAVAHSLLVSGQAHLDQVNGQIRTERQLLQREQLLLAERQSPARIAEEAAARGMVAGGEQTWMSLDPGTVATVATGGTGADPVDPSDATDADGSELASATTQGAAGER